MEVHRILGGGLSEVIYKDALEYEFQQQNIPYQREKEYAVRYKEVLLPHKFYADFVLFDDVVFEVKAASDIVEKYIAQTLNYIKLTKGHLGIIVNFGNSSLEHKRLIA